MNKALLLLGASAALLLAGCSSTRVATTNVAQAEQLAPVQTGSVSATALPPIGPNGEVQQGVGGPPPLTPTTATDPMGNPLVADVQPGVSGSLTSAGGDLGSTGRDLSGGLTVEKLLGSWTVVSGADQCQLNLTQTAKTGTGRYRASAPACALQGLSVVASWSLAGSQVQLFDEGGSLVAALILSGNRFVGTLAGGTGVSMVG
ncbi:MAG TPA: AprI/Inh family metalloprotease inhibitor [Devosia sp.]|nr:AprI/Inh family metalloprotease inhibitor [Devosia sp.]